MNRQIEQNKRRQQEIRNIVLNGQVWDRWPTQAEHGIPKDQLASAIPKEHRDAFWRSIAGPQGLPPGPLRDQYFSDPTAFRRAMMNDPSPQGHYWRQNDLLALSTDSAPHKYEYKYPGPAASLTSSRTPAVASGTPTASAQLSNNGGIARNNQQSAQLTPLNTANSSLTSANRHQSTGTLPSPGMQPNAYASRVNANGSNRVAAQPGTMGSGDKSAASKVVEPTSITGSTSSPRDSQRQGSISHQSPYADLKSSILQPNRPSSYAPFAMRASSDYPESMRRIAGMPSTSGGLSGYRPPHQNLYSGPYSSTSPTIPSSNDHATQGSTQQGNPSGSQSLAEQSLNDLEKRVRVPGGLRLIAASIRLPYGSLADDLERGGDGSRRRVPGSRTMDAQTWLGSLNDEEQTLLKAKLKKMGVL